MSWVAAAIGGSALLGAGTALYAGGKQSGGAQDALSFQMAVQEQNQRNYLEAQRKVQPFIDSGTSAVGRINASYEDPNTFLNTPDYQFGVKEGMNALQNSSAARGGMLGGNFLRGAVQFGQDYGTNYLQRYRAGLMTTANMGASAAAGAAGATGAFNNNNTAGAGQVGGAMNYLGGAQASGAVGASNAVGGGIQNYLLMNALNSRSSSYAMPRRPGLTPWGGGGELDQGPVQ